jgi:hypothetical protein
VEVIEEQVDVEVVATDLHVILAANEREADAEFEQELADVCEQLTFEVALARLAVERQKVEVVGVFKKLPR